MRPCFFLEVYDAWPDIISRPIQFLLHAAELNCCVCIGACKTIKHDHKPGISCQQNSLPPASKEPPGPNAGCVSTVHCHLLMASLPWKNVIVHSKQLCSRCGTLIWVMGGYHAHTWWHNTALAHLCICSAPACRRRLCCRKRCSRCGTWIWVMDDLTFIHSLIFLILYNICTVQNCCLSAFCDKFTS